MSQRVTIDVFEEVDLILDDSEHSIHVKVDTGALASSIDKKLATELGIYSPEKVVKTRKYKSALGLQRREIIPIKFRLKGIEIDTLVSVIERSHLSYSMIIGRKDLKQFVIEYNPQNDPQRNEV